MCGSYWCSKSLWLHLLVWQARLAILWSLFYYEWHKEKLIAAHYSAFQNTYCIWHILELVVYVLYACCICSKRQTISSLVLIYNPLLIIIRRWLCIWYCVWPLASNTTSTAQNWIKGNRFTSLWIDSKEQKYPLIDGTKMLVKMYVYCPLWLMQVCCFMYTCIF